MIIGIGTPRSQSKIPRPIGPSPLSYFNPHNVRFYYWFRADELLTQIALKENSKEKRAAA